MKRLLYLLGRNTEIIIRRGQARDEFVIRGVEYVDDSNKFCAEVRVNLDDLSRARFGEDVLWKHVRDELAYRLGAAVREYYERPIEEEHGHEDH